MNNINIDEGWQYSLPTSRKKISEEFNYVFPPISYIFSINKQAMNIYWYEIGCVKWHRKNIIFQQKEYDAIISQVLDDSLLEILSPRICGFGNKRFIRIGTTSKTPNTIWHKCLKQPCCIYPLTKLASCENTRITAESIVQIIKLALNLKTILNFI